MASNIFNLLRNEAFYTQRTISGVIAQLLTLSKVRLYSSGPSPRKAEFEAPTYTKTDHEYKITKKATVEALVNLLGVRPINALEILSRNKSLKETSPAKMKINYALFFKNNVKLETLLKYPELLSVDDPELKLEQIQKLQYDINTVSVLMLLPMGPLSRLVYNEVGMGKEDGKISKLSRLLQVSEEDTCKFLVEKRFLCSLSLEKIETSIKILTEFGLNLKDIANDLWVLRYSNKTIRDRLSEAKSYKIETMKTWMVRATPEIIQTYVRRRSDNKSILGDSSLTEYLSERLECSEDIANYIIQKQPALKNKSLKKLKGLIDLLLAEGFDPHQIWRVPKILIHSVATTRKRLKQLQDKNIRLDSLHMLTKSQKQFTQYYDALVKSKKKNKNDDTNEE